MALGTYGELQAAIAAWLARSGDPTLTPFIPDFIRLAEARVNRELRVRAMERRATAEIDGGFVALPPGFLEMRDLQLNLDPPRRLELVAPGQLDGLRLGARRGLPRWYCILGGEIQLAPAPDGIYELEMAYWRQVEPLTLVAPGNWLLEAAPDVYLYGALLEATAFIGNDERLALWASAYDRAVAGLQAADDRGTWSGSTPRARPDAASP